MNYDSIDYIIVGGGSAGCVLAARLSESPTCKVVLIEAGGEDRNPFIHIPAGYIKTMVDPSINWMFESEAEATTAHRRISIPRGKVLGGSSAINGMLYVRGQPSDFDGWAQRGNKGWSYEDVLPYFKKAEHFEALATSNGDYDPYTRAVGGPLHVATIPTRYSALDKVIAAAEQFGWPHNKDYNNGEQDGFSYYQVNQKNGLRFSAKKAYLNRVRNRANLKILTSAHVTKILFSGRMATGVRFQRHGKIHDISASGEILISAGAVQSPQILQLSGIGDSQRLQDLGISVQQHLPGVGENLADHYISRLSWRLSKNISLNNKVRGISLLGEILKFALTRRGILSLPAGILAGFVRSREGLDGPDIQYHITHASFANPAKRVFDKYPGLTFGSCQLRPESRGQIHIKSSNAFVAPIIINNYLSTDEDCRVHLAGMKIARQIMESKSMENICAAELRPGSEIRSDEELLAYARASGVTLYHPVSTCRMGPDPRQGDVVDAHLRVYGCENLRVVDASIMPTITSGNTNAPTVMIAEKASDLIISNRR